MSGQAGDRRECGDHLSDSRLQFPPLGVMIDREITLDRGEQADHLLLTHLQAASDSLVRADCEPSRRDQILTPDSKPVDWGPRSPFPPENATRSNPSRT